MCGFLTWLDIINDFCPSYMFTGSMHHMHYPCWHIFTGCIPNTLLEGMCSHTCSPCTDIPPYFSWYEHIQAHLTSSLTPSPPLCVQRVCTIIDISPCPEKTSTPLNCSEGLWILDSIPSLNLIYLHTIASESSVAQTIPWFILTLYLCSLYVDVSSSFW